MRPIIFLSTTIVGEPMGESVVCSKTCYNKEVNHLKKFLKGHECAGDNEWVLWDKDGKNGENDSIMSLSILVTWWREGNIYSEYRGSKNGLNKVQILQTLANKMNAAGVHCHHTAKHMMGNISHLEGQF